MVAYLIFLLPPILIYFDIKNGLPALKLFLIRTAYISLIFFVYKNAVIHYESKGNIKSFVYIILDNSYSYTKHLNNIDKEKIKKFINSIKHRFNVIVSGLDDTIGIDNIKPSLPYSPLADRIKNIVQERGNTIAGIIAFSDGYSEGEIPPKSNIIIITDSIKTKNSGFGQYETTDNIWTRETINIKIPVYSNFKKRLKINTYIDEKHYKSIYTPANGKINFPISFKSPGYHTIRFTIDGKDDIKWDNTAIITFKVEKRKNKLLFIVGKPDIESRFLCGFFNTIKDIEFEIKLANRIKKILADYVFLFAIPDRLLARLLPYLTNVKGIILYPAGVNIGPGAKKLLLGKGFRYKKTRHIKKKVALKLKYLPDIARFISNNKRALYYWNNIIEFDGYYSGILSDGLMYNGNSILTKKGNLIWVGFYPTWKSEFTRIPEIGYEGYLESLWGYLANKLIGRAKDDIEIKNLNNRKGSNIIIVSKKAPKIFKNNREIKGILKGKNKNYIFNAREYGIYKVKSKGKWAVFNASYNSNECKRVDYNKKFLNHIKSTGGHIVDNIFKATRLLKDRKIITLEKKSLPLRNWIVLILIIMLISLEWWIIRYI